MRFFVESLVTLLTIVQIYYHNSVKQSIYCNYSVDKHYLTIRAVYTLLYMKKENILLWILTISSLAISLLALAAVLPKQESLGFDYLGALLGFGSLLIAIYVAVQIYQSFNLKKEIDIQNRELLSEMNERNIKQISNLKKEVASILENRIEDYNHTISGNIYQIHAIAHMRQNHFKAALNSLMEGLEEVNQATDKSPLEGIISYIRGVKIEGCGTFQITKKEYDKYASIVWNASNHEYIDIIDYLRLLLPKNEDDPLLNQQQTEI